MARRASLEKLPIGKTALPVQMETSYNGGQELMETYRN